jgi:hypothetical protein
MVGRACHDSFRLYAAGASGESDAKIVRSLRETWPVQPRSQEDANR